MQEVIEAGREKVPLMAKMFQNAENALGAHKAILHDFESVKTESGRQAVYERCLAELENLELAIASVESAWTAFETVLLAYTRKSRSGKKKKAVDLPGQMFLFGGEEKPAEESPEPGDMGSDGNPGAVESDPAQEQHETKASDVSPIGEAIDEVFQP